MPLETDTTNWSGEGTFTQLLIERLRDIDAVRFVRIEDAPATRSEADYNFISNELFVGFATVERKEPARRFGVFPGSRIVTTPAMTLTGLETALTALEGVGAPDYGASCAAVPDPRLQTRRARPNLRGRYSASFLMSRRVQADTEPVRFQQYRVCGSVQPGE